jgi:hypothetical protein
MGRLSKVDEAELTQENYISDGLFKSANRYTLIQNKPERLGGFLADNKTQIIATPKKSGFEIEVAKLTTGNPGMCSQGLTRYALTLDGRPTTITTNPLVTSGNDRVNEVRTTPVTEQDASEAYQLMQDFIKGADKALKQKKL